MANEQKTPMARSLPMFALARAAAEIAKRGQALPGHVTAITGDIVTINFDVAGLTLPQVQMPLFGPEYIRYPVQVGDQGVAFPASVYIGGVSGLGTGTATDTIQGNLSTLVWFPIANKSWSTPPGSNANTLALYGHAGLLLLDSLTGNSSIKLTATGITLTFAGHTIVINSTGVIIDGRTFLLHEHVPGTYIAGSTPVTGDSGAVV